VLLKPGLRVIHRSYTNSYQSAIVNTALYHFQVIWHWETSLRITACNFMHDVYIAEIYRPRAIFFAADIMDIQFYIASSRKKLYMYRIRWCVTVVQRHPHCYHLEARMRFLFVFHCNYRLCLSSVVSEMQWLVGNLRFSPFFTHPSLARVFPFCGTYITLLKKLSALSS